MSILQGYLLCCVRIGLDWIQILVHQLDWTGLGSVARGFGLDWIVSTRSIPYSGTQGVNVSSWGNRELFFAVPRDISFPGDCTHFEDIAVAIARFQLTSELLTGVNWFAAATLPPPPPRPARSASASATMCRRPLLPLLALAALLALPPASHGLHCFTCQDRVTLSSSSSSNPLLSSLQSSAGPDLPSCSAFDPSDCDLKLYPCLSPSNRSCAKALYRGKTWARGCSTTEIAKDKCTTSGDWTTCYCTGDYCNSAGLTAPALLLLLPAALLAALYSRQ